MKPRRPYLLRALLDWILDNQQTPYLLVQVDDSVTVPASFVQDGRIVLNLSPMAIRNLDIGNEEIVFDGRFSGVSFPVRIPVRAVLAIYAKESGEGMLFEAEYAEAEKGGGETGDHRPNLLGTESDRKPPSRGEASHLKVVK